MIRDKKNRTDLSKAIPIGTPLVVHIDTCNVCNFSLCFSLIIKESSDV